MTRPRRRCSCGQIIRNRQAAAAAPVVWRRVDLHDRRLPAAAAFDLMRSAV